ncbi:branched-chain amino acid transport system II carrier protein [Candidatus Protochlamydia phocaeensis]|uniref:branched-chain amino acid transport system II carrier protein n=1 Tax=Candidatus Protochlamydia phocaeensis TaxID=1414722 RepID=UPI0009ADF4CD|nr:branched-chain amino acid transport system II carrier protein [Candidatus Protochlamydia phocaeensis]
MSSFKRLDLYALGLAIFSMFFGAGNIIFPLALGKHALDQTPYAIAGLLLTAVAIPFCGLLAMFLYEGNIKAFFGRLGRIPGLLLAFAIIALLGPLGSTPRCIALAYSTFQLSFPGISSTVFSAISCVIIFFLAYKKNRLLDILGYILTPLLVALLAAIVFLGILNAPSENQAWQAGGLELFWHGLKEGYNTMDLLAAFFFAPVIIAFMQKKTASFSSASERLGFILKASGIGALLLSVVYIGFSCIAASYADYLDSLPSDQLLAALAFKILGPQAGLIVCLTVVLACLTTAIALIAAFADFMQKEILKEKVSYPLVLLGSLILTFNIAIFEFQGISQFLGPILEIFYPALIGLTAINFGQSVYQLYSSKSNLQFKAE